MRRTGLSKSRFLSGLQCVKRLWLEVHRPELKTLSGQAEQRFMMGDQVGQVARDQYPGGRLIEHQDNLAAALEETRQRLADGSGQPLFEATFEHEGVLVRTDILLRAGDRVSVTEVKAAGSVKDQYLPDCAVQAWVLEGAGYPVDQVCLAHVDTGFVYPGGGDYRGLLQSVDVTADVRAYLPEIPPRLQAFREALAGEMPAIEVGDQCKNPYECPFLAHCNAGAPEYPVSLLPYGKRVAGDLLAQGIADVRDIPEGILEKPAHERVRRVTVSGEPELDGELTTFVRELLWPRYYLDFETIQFAVPIWAGTRPYEQLPFQWSCHVEDADGDMRHAEFLDTTWDAPMRAFAETLLAAMGEQGPIIVYSAFEKTRLNDLAGRFPDLADGLNALIGRLVDLLPPTRAHYYHPAMKGSFSIKAVLPTVAPELDYQGLDEVHEGGEAQMAYLEMIRPDTPMERRERLRQALLEYCKLDTRAMVEMTRVFGAS